MAKDFIFTSESVSNGHPDKVADQISDAILDAIIAKDKYAHVACETYVKTGMVLVGGEIRTKSWVNHEELIRKTINNIGYTDADFGFDGHSCAVISAIGTQSADISMGVDEYNDHEQGAGDQGLMFGYATDETDVLMPAPILYSHKLMQKHAEIRNNHKLTWLRPDAKAQVTFEYEDHLPKRIDAIVLSTQHDPAINMQDLKEAVIEEIIKPTIPKKYLDDKTRFFINPTGRFVLGGPLADCGLTGRKIIVDTYGGMARHGGGAFSGKDPSKVDRSAAYYARYLAKNVVKAGLAKRCELQIAYAIGIADPVSICINTFHTNAVEENKIVAKIKSIANFKPKALIENLNLLSPIYQKTACYGHFGRELPEFTWENTDLVDALKQA